MSRRLVTGATGFIGGHLVASLTAQGHAVRCLVRRSSDTTHLPAAGVELIVGDVSDAGAVQRAVQGCDIVYHLAGKTSARHRAELYRVNEGGCEQVARACAAQKTPPLLILVSSLAAAGPCPPHRLITERDPARPVSAYGRSKYAGECATWSWADRMPLSIVRPAIVFGPRNRDMLPIFQVIQRLGVHAVPGMTPRRVSLIHQQDLLEILDRVVRVGQRVKPQQPASAAVEPSEDAAGIYFAAAPEQPTYAELGRMIARALDRSPLLVLPLPEPLIWLIAAGNQCVTHLRGRSDSLNLDKIREAVAGDWISSTDRVRDELGFQPPCSLQQRLNETARWYRTHGWV